MRKHAVGLFGVPHVFLDAEVVDAEIEVECGGHRHRTEIRRTVRTGPHVMQLGERRNLLQVCDAAAVHDGGADVVDQLLLDELQIGNTRSVSSVCRMYSWMPKLWTLRSKWSAAAIATGLRSVAPCAPVRT